MIEGISGILAVSPPHERPTYLPTRRRLEWPNGAVGYIYTASEPEEIRGPEHDLAWGEEVAAWQYGKESWSNLQLTMRYGVFPRTVITTTPKPKKFLRDILDLPGCVHTTGSTYENKDNLAPPFMQQIIQEFEGTHRGLQELEGIFLDEMPGALWTRDVLESTRVAQAPELARIVIGVDPAITSKAESDETGIIAVGVTATNPPEGFVLADRSGRYSPDGWAREVIELYNELGADRVIAESNQGGEMVRHTIETVRGVSRDGAPLDGRRVAVRLIHASQSKIVRAEPISAKWEQGRAHMVGTFPELEDQLCQWNPLSGEKSPDRLDAMVHALKESMVLTNFGLGDAIEAMSA